MFLDSICTVIVQIANLVSGLPIVGGILGSVLGQVFDAVGCQTEEEEA